MTEHTPSELLMSGPCQICGAINYALSFGGPSVCPSCDCGCFGTTVVERQGKEIIALRAELAALTQAAAAGRDVSEPVLAALEAWFKFQSLSNTTELYNQCARYFGSDFNPAEYDSVE